VLCVTVSDAGFIDHKVFDPGEPLTREDLIRISNYLNDNFAGSTLAEIRDRMLRLMEDERARMDAMMRNAIRLASRGLADALAAAEVVVEGTETLLLQPDLADLVQVRKLFEAFADRARLVAMLNLCMEGAGVRVFIDEESDLTSGLDCSLVAKPYGVGDRVLGTIGVFGPSRMEYPRLIPLVDYLGKRLSETLAATI
jgi:heat-inducible transcriptional repressor